MLRVRCTRRRDYAGRLHVRAAVHRLDVDALGLESQKRAAQANAELTEDVVDKVLDAIEERLKQRAQQFQQSKK